MFSLEKVIFFLSMHFGLYPSNWLFPDQDLKMWYPPLNNLSRDAPASLSIFILPSCRKSSMGLSPTLFCSSNATLPRSPNFLSLASLFNSWSYLFIAGKYFCLSSIFPLLQTLSLIPWSLHQSSYSVNTFQYRVTNLSKTKSHFPDACLTTCHPASTSAPVYLL